MKDFYFMGNEGKSERDMIIELHTHVLGENGVMDRLERLEQRASALHDFKVKWMAVMGLIGGGVTLGFNALVSWMKSGGGNGNH